VGEKLLDRQPLKELKLHIAKVYVVLHGRSPKLGTTISVFELTFYYIERGGR
jgi:hypothetical protein